MLRQWILENPNILVGVRLRSVLLGHSYFALIDEVLDFVPQNQTVICDMPWPLMERTVG